MYYMVFKITLCSHAYFSQTGVKIILILPKIIPFKLVVTHMEVNTSDAVIVWQMLFIVVHAASQR